eukprot:4876000-Amphidinium_carterae.3
MFACRCSVLNASDSRRLAAFASLSKSQHHLIVIWPLTASGPWVLMVSCFHSLSLLREVRHRRSVDSFERPESARFVFFMVKVYNAAI